jgi:preprotein translocase subunit SecA
MGIISAPFKVWRAPRDAAKLEQIRNFLLLSGGNFASRFNQYSNPTGDPNFMIGFVNKVLQGFFGNKSERDVKALLPRVEEINRFFEAYSGLNHDELRAKTLELKAKINESLRPYHDKLTELKAIRAEGEDPQAQAARFEEYDSTIRERDKALEEILHNLLPEAFAVVKETARRLSQFEEIRVTATDMDRELAAEGKDFVRIEGEHALYRNRWNAAGAEVVWNMIHYDVQLIGGMVLHSGKISEMSTGEGKTLVSTLPAYLNALSGLGVHIVTVNDYLARRDSEWNGPLFQFHGLRVDCIDKHRPNTEARRKAYRADITYGTNNEFGFDYLRDNMSHAVEELVQRKHHFAMVDEVDSVLIDDARTPLIISGPVPRGEHHEFHQLKPRIESLVESQKRYLNTALADARKFFSDNKLEEAGLPLFRAYRGLPKNKALIKFLSEPGVRALLLKTEAHYLQDQQKEMHKADAELFFVIDEKNNSIELTEKGIEHITSRGEDAAFFVLPDVGAEIAEIEKSALDSTTKAEEKTKLMQDFQVKSERIHTINQLLKAYCLFEKDIEYIVDQNKVKIVDEQTGRVLDGRRYSDGLHQAIEAKENVKVEAATQTFATITLQNFFRMYHKLAGMTGTAETEAGELWEIYKLDVVVIPTHRPVVRGDQEDLVYKTKREKYAAIIDQVASLVEAGRPVLVGTTSVEISELLSRMMTLRKIKHNVLNAKQHQREAEIVAEAGRAGTVTIATNMAGRGTDIKLGDGVKDAGGLAIIGTERHESRRVDRQLRGRSGRQGDPGSSIFFVSLEDDLMRLFGSERISNIMDRFGYKEGEVIQHSMITKSIERAQKKVEENNFGVRKRLLEYDDVMNAQREIVYNRRRNALYGERVHRDVLNALADLVDETVEQHKESSDYENFMLEGLKTYGIQWELKADEFENLKIPALADKIHEQALLELNRRQDAIIQIVMQHLRDLLQQPEQLKEGIGIPIGFGGRSLQLGVRLGALKESSGRALVTELEKALTLFLTDEAWKNHLRDMDDLKQSVQNAVYEQKDPLVIYKMESFGMFKKMLSEIYQELISMLFQARIQGNEEKAPANQAPRKALMTMPGQTQTTTATKAEYGAASSTAAAQGSRSSALRHRGVGQSAEHVASQVRVGPKIGRNDPCPCGSGRKFKACHGKDAEG